MTLETNFLLAAARAFVLPEAPRPDRAGLDSSALLELAETQSVAPLLNRILGGDAPGDLRAVCARQARSKLILTSALLSLLDLFEQRGIAAIPLKGPALALSAYGDLSLRSFGDLDLLVRPSDVVRTRDTLIGCGWQLDSSVHWRSSDACLRSKERQLTFSRARVSVDLHWSLLPDYFAGSFHEESVWDYCTLTPLAGRTVRTLSREDQLLFLCAHGAKHRWNRLGWIVDLALVLKREPLDWSQALSRARAAHIERIVLLGILLAADLFDSDVPSQVRDRIAAAPVVSQLAREVRLKLFAPNALHSPIRDGLFNLRMIESFGDKLRFIRGLAITPTEAEWRDLRLPPALYFLYYPYRLARLGGLRRVTTASAP